VRRAGLPGPEPVGHTSRVLSRLLILLGLAAASAGLTSAKATAATDTTTTTTVVLVRHAEKDTNFVGSDPPLNTAGLLRSRELARVLGDLKFSAIYVTPWVRSRKTADPLAQRQGDSLVIMVDAIDGTVRGIRQHPGGTILVVGHSNTVPQILAALAGQPDFAKLVVGYDDLFVLTLTRGAEPRLLHLHYGAPSAYVR